jgi:hypothetical protein
MLGIIASGKAIKKMRYSAGTTIFVTPRKRLSNKPKIYQNLLLEFLSKG